MFGYEVIRELKNRFSGYWRPKTDTIYPAFEKLEEGGLVTSRIEFRDEGLDRKHYALTKKGRGELSQTMRHWTKMMEVLEFYEEATERIFRYKVRSSRTDSPRPWVRWGKELGGGPLAISKSVRGRKRS